MRLVAFAGVLLALVFGVASTAAADDDLRFRRTTPRADLTREGGVLRLGVPAGRAWGVESALLPVPRRGVEVRIAVEVTDPNVGEAFLRVAWYERAVGRSRQIAVDDSPTLGFGPSRTLEIALDPPEGAVAYRVRVLVRLRPGADRSAPGAIGIGEPQLTRNATPLTRLLPALP